ncbi:MAG: TlpA disulfide reductase family protein [Bryobacteraceae bacterium]|jgi:thiol-disulfide isomerase/thioredoxin
MKRLALTLVAACWCGVAQPQPPAKSAEVPPLEKADLERALGEAGASPLERVRAIEKHLAQYPDSPNRVDLERSAAIAAIAANDDGLVVTWGERVLARQPADLQLLARVTHSLLAVESKDNAERAIRYAHRAEELIPHMTQEGGARFPMSAGEWQAQCDRAMGRALTDEARATGYLGRREEALALAQRAFTTWPNAESAREMARVFDRLGKPAEAAAAMADAFTVPDLFNTDADRAHDRGRLGELYRQAHGSETGLGDLVLAAYDRNLALAKARELGVRQSDPNAALTDPMAFTLSGVDGAKLSMADLKGKVLVLDFWATWCAPCREQHPLYEQVKQRFRDNPDVVFLSIDADADRQPVKPFLQEAGWQGPVYFEDGLARVLAVESLPTTILIDRRGQVFSRMNGYVKQLFVDALTDRIRGALAAAPRP